MTKIPKNKIQNCIGAGVGAGSLIHEKAVSSG